MHRPLVGMNFLTHIASVMHCRLTARTVRMRLPTQTLNYYLLWLVL